MTMANAKKPPEDQSGAKEVADFMRKLKHPLKAELEAVRSIILGAHPDIREEIKWNSPSFRTTEFFATIGIRNDAVLVVLHQGAKVKDSSTAGPAVSDPAGLLEWRGKIRALVWFRDMKSIKSGRAAFESIVRQWIA